jgi:hypothetical protein
MVGYALSAASMSALITDQGGVSGVPAARLQSDAVQEQAHRRLVSLIASTEEFAHR